MIRLTDILKEVQLNESGIRNINQLAKENKKADLYFHMDLDGVTTAIAMKAYLEKYGIRVVNAEHIQYGGREYSAPKPTPGHMVVLVDFAHGKPGVTIHTDHHESQSGVEKGTTSSFKKKPSNVETLSQEISPRDIFPNEDIKIISTVDSADFARQGISVDDVIATAFKFDKNKDIQKNRMAMGLVANKILLAFKGKPKFLENIVMQANPSLLSIYTVALRNAKAAGLKPQDLGIAQSRYMTSQRPELMKRNLGNVKDIDALANGNYGMVGTVLVQFGTGDMRGGGYDRYTPFKMNPEAEYLILGYPMGLVQASKNPFKKGSNPYNLGDIAMKILKRHKSYLNRKQLTFREIKKIMEADIERMGSDRSFGFTLKDLSALFGKSAKGIPTDERRELIDAIANKQYRYLTQSEKEKLETITVSVYDIIEKQSGGHKDITNISGLGFLGNDTIAFTKRIMQDLANELKDAKLK
ncbi:hypothetical protein UFOVP449_13 [uncultured Caudovirales phage]|uniref:Uncharacterized protein n=1 Tax=uncultured Caudovirales phage TaxID=2100421 RepID=A0A6J5MB95_9CAUD|nr:hypothetical protein UFOVP449_13 [uncultured Caudovirales phage]